MSQHLLRSLPDGPPELQPEAGIGIQSSSIGALCEAKAAADQELRNVTKSKSNDFFHSTYADLDTLTRLVRPIYARHGLSFAQAPWFINGDDLLLTTLGHSSGQWIRSVMRLAPVPDKSGNITPQAHGSALTYARRYALSGMANITQTDYDDDGNEASGSAHVEPLNIPKQAPDEWDAKAKEQLLFNAIDAISSVQSLNMFMTSPEMIQLREWIPRAIWIDAYNIKKQEIIPNG